jgi:hypothetical protein
MMPEELTVPLQRLEEAQEKKAAAFKKFVWRQAILYALFNMAVNWAVPHFRFNHPESVLLITGDRSLMMFLLPLAFFVPFCITHDMCARILVFCDKGKADFVIPATFPRKKFIARKAAIYGGITWVIAAAVLGSLYLYFPKNKGFDGDMLAVLLAILAGMLAVFFTFYSARLIKNQQS